MGSDRNGSARVEKVARDEYRIVTHIDIDAPAALVWSTLTDWGNLASWSSSFVSPQGTRPPRRIRSHLNRHRG